MSKLPSRKSIEILSFLLSRGFEKVRTSGSHVRLRNGSRFVTVPYHAGKSIPPGMLRAILRQAGIAPEELTKKH